MDDLNELIRKLKNLVNELPNIYTDLAITTALNGKALAERTIREQGFGATYRNPDYIEEREKRGLEINWVTLAFTNEMWRGMIPSEVEISGSKYMSNLIHTNESGLYKMQENVKRYGNFINIALELNDNEQVIRESIGFELNRYLNKYINE